MINDNYYRAVPMDKDMVFKSNSKSPFSTDRGKTI